MTYSIRKDVLQSCPQFLAYWINLINPCQELKYVGTQKRVVHGIACTPEETIVTEDVVEYLVFEAEEQ